MHAVKDGLLVRTVVAGSGADKARLVPGDVLITVDGVRVTEGADLIQIVTSHDVGDRLKVEYRRDGEYKTTTVRLSARPRTIRVKKADR
jgi:serine protease Do